MRRACFDQAGCVTAVGGGEEEGALWACRPWAYQHKPQPAPRQSAGINIARLPHRARPRAVVPSLSPGASSEGVPGEPPEESVAVSAVPLNHSHSGACNYPPPTRRDTARRDGATTGPPGGPAATPAPKRERSKQSEASGPHRLNSSNHVVSSSKMAAKRGGMANKTGDRGSNTIKGAPPYTRHREAWDTGY